MRIIGAVNDPECVALLQWALPQLGLRWKGFKNVRRQVVRRVAARAAELGVDAHGYRERLARDPEERRVLDALCFVTISRFYRDRQVYDELRTKVLPALATAALARGERVFRIWSAGCASGEEPYTVAMVWHLELAARFPDLALDIIATDTNDEVLARARRGAYDASSLVELPAEWRDEAFVRIGDTFVLADRMRAGVSFVRADIREWRPAPPVHAILCRNLAFTYFDEPAQRSFVERAREVLVPDGVIVIGGHEKPPEGFRRYSRSFFAAGIAGPATAPKS
jgi:chemotaxis protein methyltransferase CheR